MHSRGCSLFTMNVVTLGSLRERGLHPVPMVKGRSEKPCHSKDEKSSSLYGGRTHFFVLFLFFGFILWIKERNTVGLQQSDLVCQGKTQWWVGLRTASPHVRVTRWILFSALSRQRSWLIKWALDPREMEMLGTAFGKKIPPAYLGQFLALAVTTDPGFVSQSREEWVRLALVNWRVQVCCAFGLKLLFLNEQTDKG